MTSVYCLLQVCTAPRVLFLYHNRLAFSAITRNITTLNLLHTKIFNYLVFRNVQNFIHTKIFTYTVASYSRNTIDTNHFTLLAIIVHIIIMINNLCIYENLHINISTYVHSIIKINCRC